MKLTKPLPLLVLSLLAIAGVTYLGPAEATLGTNVRVVYLHGAWVWTAMAAFIAAGAVGLLAFILRRKPLHHWSRAIGRTGLLFWISYLPISLWAMQANWNGLFLAEPRWRVALVFAIGGLLLQIGLTLLENPIWASGFNIAYIIALFSVLQTTANVMHPPAPMLESDAWRIQLYFFGLTVLTLFAAWQVARIFFSIEANRLKVEG
ncbi:MAG: hypothetical protein HN413_08230 [Chloroflexi bacterium]|nr:hypothetical protein [Chloroflexota bacterium]